MLFSPLPDNVINILELYDTVFYNKSSRSIKFQEKYLREEYQKLEKELSRKREELSFLQHKINTITEFLDNVDTITSDDISQLYNISNEREIRSEEIVQDIYHLTKTPLRTVLGALNSLNITKNECDNSSEEIIEIIRKQVSLIEIILDGYRQILVDDPELKTLCNIPQFLKSSAESTAKLGNKNIVCLIDSFPEKICDQGNSYAILLLKPLIDNAIEASPDGNNIYVRVTENQNEFIVNVNHLKKDTKTSATDLI